MKNKKLYIISPFIVIQTTTSAGIRWEPEPSDDGEGEGVPDWIAYLLLMIVVLMMAGKFK